MIIAYLRCSTDDQDLRMQYNALKKSGFDVEFSDEGKSGKNLERDGLSQALKYLREGDILLVYSLSRLSRSVSDLIELSAMLQAKNCHLKSLTENIDTSGAMGRMVFIVMGAIAQLERELAEERRIQGTLAAREAGVKFGRPLALSIERMAYLEVNLDKPYGYFMERWGVSRSTVARAKKQVKENTCLPLSGDNTI